MKRLLSTALFFLLVLAFCLPALAQEGEPAAGTEGGEEAQPADDDAAPADSPDDAPADDAAPPPTDDLLKTSSADLAPTPVAKEERGTRKQSWKDIVVIPRKPFMKSGRFEIMPSFSTTINDNLIQHFALGGEFNYFLTDILSVGVTGMYYFKNVLDEEFWTRYHFGRIPSLNRYKYTVTLNFGYVPIYGKLALVNKYILHYEVYATAGVGGSGTEIIPRDYNNEVFSNAFSLTFPVGMGGRLFITKWLAAHVSVKDYMMLDKFEPSPRVEQKAAEAAKKAETRFINNIMITLGASFFFPLDFQYTTFR